MYYVKMIDTFLSGWGVAENRTANLVIECETMAEAEIVKKNAENRTDMKKIEIVRSRPTFNEKKHQVSYRTKQDMKQWFIPNHFKK